MRIETANLSPIQFRHKVDGVAKIETPVTKQIQVPGEEPKKLDNIAVDFSRMSMAPALGDIQTSQVDKTRLSDHGPHMATLPCPRPDAKKSGMVTNENGTLSIIEEPTAAPTQDTGGVNFAKMFGVETEPKAESTVPKHFNAQEIEGHYFANGADKAKGLNDLSADGKKLYESIKARYLDSVPKCPHGSPTLYLTGGLPGSGKGFILSKIMGDSPQMVRVDPDEIKKDILHDLARKDPGLLDEAATNKTWGNDIHETSSFMAKRLMDDALVSGKDIVFDSSMASGNVGKYRGYAATARQNGYKVNGIISDVSVETANQRALGRADKPTILKLDDGSTKTLPGRLTERSYIEGCAKHLDSNLKTYLSEGMYDHCMVFDNNSSENPAQVKMVYKREIGSDGIPRTVIANASAEMKEK